MASETKRSSTNKVPVALPKADAALNTNATLVSPDVSLQQAIGSRIRVTTTQPNQNTIEGTVYTADPITNLLVINTSPDPPTNITPNTLSAPEGSYRFIPIPQISSFHLLSLPQLTSDNDAPKSAPPISNNLDTSALTTRLQRAVTTAQADLARRGPKGTTAVEQALFDGLSRMYPIKWQGTSMIISDSFVVEKPYDPKNVKLLPGHHGDVERVRKSVERQKTNAGLRQPINLAKGNGAKAPTSDAQRKGG